MGRKILRSALVLIAVVCAAWSARAQDDIVDVWDSHERVEGALGAFTESIPIEVPAFHGLEPSLALTYDSGRHNGFVGVGWRLSGLSVIERAFPRQGAPLFHPQSEDQWSGSIFVLDGEELAACTDSMTSPSCTSTGTHVNYFATRVESYLRIKRNTTTNTWELTKLKGDASLFCRFP